MKQNLQSRGNHYPPDLLAGAPLSPPTFPYLPVSSHPQQNPLQTSIQYFPLKTIQDRQPYQQRYPIHPSSSQLTHHPPHLLAYY